ncbi:hypothetical protein SDC9_91151 [bioreactor metagenome]|uniref:Uncharacterized protein n=1 Tax=bioreactor metagenome TaxID=1076179 RepID=A0A645A0U2_9ZZZZ
MAASSLMGRVRSHVSPFTLAARTSWASRELILSAICNPVIPSSYSRTELSGNVIFIIACISFSSNFFSNCKCNDFVDYSILIFFYFTLIVRLSSLLRNDNSIILITLRASSGFTAIAAFPQIASRRFRKYSR